MLILKEKLQQKQIYRKKAINKVTHILYKNMMSSGCGTEQIGLMVDQYKVHQELQVKMELQELMETMELQE